jgi:hypothetical protein
MSLYPSFFGSVDLPGSAEARPPRGRPDGVRVVRRPQTTPGEGWS